MSEDFFKKIDQDGNSNRRGNDLFERARNVPAALIALIDRAGPAACGPLTRPAYPATR